MQHHQDSILGHLHLIDFVQPDAIFLLTIDGPPRCTKPRTRLICTIMKTEQNLIKHNKIGGRDERSTVLADRWSDCTKPWLSVAKCCSYFLLASFISFCWGWLNKWDENIKTAVHQLFVIIVGCWNWIARWMMIMLMLSEIVKIFRYLSWIMWKIEVNVWMEIWINWPSPLSSLLEIEN